MDDEKTKPPKKPGSRKQYKKRTTFEEKVLKIFGAVVRSGSKGVTAEQVRTITETNVAEIEYILKTLAAQAVLNLPGIEVIKPDNFGTVGRTPFLYRIKKVPS